MGGTDLRCGSISHVKVWYSCDDQSLAAEWGKYGIKVNGIAPVISNKGSKKTKSGNNMMMG